MKELKIIAIPDKYTIYVNSGFNDHILKKGHILSIVEVGQELFDIDGTSFGNALRVKDTVEVIDIFPNFSICRKRKNLSDFVNNLFSSDETTSDPTYLALNVASKSITPLFEKEISPIEIGDLLIIK